MGSYTKPRELPIIDFSKKKLKASSESWQLASNEVRHALEEYGCFIAVYDEISSELSHDMFSASQQLFDLPLQTKLKNVSEKSYYGYIKLPMIPLYESLGIGDATTLQGISRFTQSMFPSGNETLRKIVHSYTKQLSEVEQMVKKMVFESYGVEKHYDSHVESTTYLFRFMKYRVPQKDETNIGAYAHTDKSFITILHQNQVNGLQVRTKSGDEWITVNFPPSSFVVMAGDAFLAWSNNKIHSAFHRVIISGEEERYSLGLFAFVDGIIQTPEELVDEKSPAKYKPFLHYGLLDFYAKNADIQSEESTLKAYCGV